MAQQTSIEWTDLSWNPTHGCSRVSTGCRECYAETLSLRYGQTTKPWTERNAAENVLLKLHKLREPLSNAKAWRGLGAAAAAAGKTDGKLVFVNSMSDLFHEQIPDEYIGQVLNVILFAGREHGHVFQVLTKRPERMRDCMRRYYSEGGLDGTGNPSLRSSGVGTRDGDWWVIPWLWLGVSIENRKWVGRADILREIPAAVRFISAEPLLGPLIPRPVWYGEKIGAPAEFWWPDGPSGEAGIDLTGIDWLIVGGESGPKHRPMDLQWARDLRDACHEQQRFQRPRTRLFVKQLGGSRPGTALEDLPEDLRIRQFPAALT